MKALGKLYNNGCIAFEKTEGNRTDRYSFWYNGTVITRLLHTFSVNNNGHIDSHFRSDISGTFELKSIAENNLFHECEPESDFTDYFNNED